MKAKLVRLAAVLALLISLTAVFLPATPAAADTPPNLTCTFVFTSSPAPWRALSLQSGDEVVQFTRDNVTLASNVTGSFTTVSTVTGTVSGDISGSMYAEVNVVVLRVAVRSGYNGFGFSVAKGTFTSTSPSGSFDVIGVSDHDFRNYYVNPPGVWVSHMVGQGYWVSTNETGAFAGQKLIGTVSSASYDEDAFPGEETQRGVATFRRYLASEITQLTPDTTFSGTYNFGAQRSIPTLTGDKIVKLTGTPNYSTPNDNNTYFWGNPTFIVNITGGPFSSGTMAMTGVNGVTYFLDPTFMGWGVGKGYIDTGSGTIAWIELHDATSLSSWSGYIFALDSNNTGDYANKEYFGTTSMTVAYPNLSASTTLYELSPPIPGSKTETTPSGTYTVDAKAEADTEVTKTGSGTPMVTVAQYSSNPGGTLAADIGKYIDVFVPDTTGVDQIEIKLWYTDADIGIIDESTLQMYWLDGATWRLCGDTGVNTTNASGYSGYIWAHITATSTPNLSYLSGQQFGGGGQGGGGAGGGAAGVPVFPNTYIGIAAALGAGILAYFARRRFVRRI